MLKKGYLYEMFSYLTKIQLELVIYLFTAMLYSLPSHKILTKLLSSSFLILAFISLNSVLRQNSKCGLIFLLHYLQISD